MKKWRSLGCNVSNPKPIDVRAKRRTITTYNNGMHGNTKAKTKVNHIATKIRSALYVGNLWEWDGGVQILRNF